MFITAHQKFIRTSARKLRLVANAVKRLSLSQALTHLRTLDKRAALPLSKTLRQAVANAVNTKGAKEKDLTIAGIEINDGPVLKRWQPVSRGRAHPIMKRTSHIRVVLETKANPNPKSEISNPKPAPKPKITKTKTPKTIKTTKTTTKSKRKV